MGEWVVRAAKALPPASDASSPASESGLPTRRRRQLRRHEARRGVSIRGQTTVQGRAASRSPCGPSTDPWTVQQPFRVTVPDVPRGPDPDDWFGDQDPEERRLPDAPPDETVAQRDDWLDDELYGREPRPSWTQTIDKRVVVVGVSLVALLVAGLAAAGVFSGGGTPATLSTPSLSTTTHGHDRRHDGRRRPQRFPRLQRHSSRAIREHRSRFSSEHSRSSASRPARPTACTVRRRRARSSGFSNRPVSPSTGFSARPRCASLGNALNNA